MAKVTDQMCVEVIEKKLTVEEAARIAGVTKQAVHNRVKYYKSKHRELVETQ